MGSLQQSLKVIQIQRGMRLGVLDLRTDKWSQGWEASFIMVLRITGKQEDA